VSLNVSAGFGGLSQGLTQMAAFADKEQERQEHERDIQLEALRAENLARLKDSLEGRRQTAMEMQRNADEMGRQTKRLKTEHDYRQQDIQAQESARARNQAAAQNRSFAHSEQLQDNAFTNQNEYRTRAQMAQSYRDAMRAAESAKNDRLKITTLLAQYQAKNPLLSASSDGGVDIQGLAQLAQHDVTLRSYLSQYEEAANREKAARAFLSKTPAPVGMFAGGQGPSQEAADQSATSPLIATDDSDSSGNGGSDASDVSTQPYDSAEPQSPDDLIPAKEPTD
jgi:hypothetical protein